MTNLLIKTICATMPEIFDEKVNAFTQKDDILVRATQTSTVLGKNSYMFTAVIFYEVKK